MREVRPLGVEFWRRGVRIRRWISAGRWRRVGWDMLGRGMREEGGLVEGVWVIYGGVKRGGG